MDETLAYARLLVAYGVRSAKKTRSQAVARIADRTAKNSSGHVTYKPRPLSGKFICAPARHSQYKAAYQIWSL